MSKGTCAIMIGEQDFEVEFDYTPGTPDVMYLPNGDPGYPGDPEELELGKIHLVLWLGDNPLVKTIRHLIEVSDLIEELAGDFELVETLVRSKLAEMDDSDEHEEHDE